MSPEDTARQFQFRDGFELVDYAEVGLPVFRLVIEAVTMVQRAIPTIQEFVMRAVSIGERDEEGIANLLGLGADIVRGAVDVLTSEGSVVRQASGGGGATSLRLTDAGAERLAVERDEYPQQEMLVIDYDGVRGVPIRLAGENVARAATLNSIGAVQIRPYPAEPPGVPDLRISEVARVLRRQTGEKFQRNILALNRIVRRSNIFREAVGLAFYNPANGEVQIAFSIHGRLSEEHERAFARNSGPRKMGFIKALDQSDLTSLLDRRLGKTLTRLLPDADALYEARRREAEAHEEVRVLSAGAARAGNSYKPAVKALAKAEEQLAIARRALNDFQLRPLAPYEQIELLDEALVNAKDSLTITTAGLQASILHGYRLRAIDALTSNRTTIRIGAGLTPQLQPRGGSQYDPLSELSQRAQRGRLTLARLTEQELFFLVQDETLAVVSNRPFLGEHRRRAGFTRTIGAVTRQPAIVAAIRQMVDTDHGWH